MNNSFDVEFVVWVNLNVSDMMEQKCMMGYALLLWVVMGFCMFTYNSPCSFDATSHSKRVGVMSIEEYD